MPAPVALVPVSPEILSSYDRAGKTDGPRANLRPLGETKMGVAPLEVVTALTRLHEAVTAAGGDFRVTELHRDVAVQKAARAKYDKWVAAGKPKPGTAAFDPKTMKAAYVATPGRSFHNAGRAIDVHLGMLKFPGLPADKQLDKLWELARACGWSPIIKAPDERASEAWHFDFHGELSGVMGRLGYEETAKCGAILVGHSGDCQTYPHTLQALIQRAGGDIGKIDGAVGPRTLGAMSQLLGVSQATAQGQVKAQDPSVFTKLLALPAK